MDRSYDLVKSSRAFRNLETSHEQISNDLTTQILEPADVRTGTWYSGDVTEKKIAVVKGVKVTLMVFRNSPNELEPLLSAFRERELEADRAELKITCKLTAFVTFDKNRSILTKAAEDRFKAFSADRDIVQLENHNNIRRPFRGFGDKQKISDASSTTKCSREKGVPEISL